MATVRHWCCCTAESSAEGSTGHRSSPGWRRNTESSLPTYQVWESLIRPSRLEATTFDDWLTALLRLTCEDAPTLVAHSLVGTLAARFAGSNSALLRGLVLYGTPGIGRYRMPIGLRIVAIRFALRPSEPNMERFEEWAFADVDRLRRENPDWLDAFTTYTRSRAVVPHVKRTMRHLVASCTKQIPDAELRRIEVPTVLLWGAQDRFVPLDLAESASTRLGWPLQVIDKAGHVPHIEQPDAFMSVLKEVTRTQS